MTNHQFRTDWIRDIDPDPRFVREMANAISKAIEDSVDDYAWGIATDYVDYPVELQGKELDDFEDAFCERIITPLSDRIYDAIIAEFKNGTP